MQNKNAGNSEKKLLSLEEQLEHFAEIIVDIYFETLKTEQHEAQYIGTSIDGDV